MSEQRADYLTTLSMIGALVVVVGMERQIVSGGLGLLILGALVATSLSASLNHKRQRMLARVPSVGQEAGGGWEDLVAREVQLAWEWKPTASEPAECEEGRERKLVFWDSSTPGTSGEYLIGYWSGHGIVKMGKLEHRHHESRIKRSRLMLRHAKQTISPGSRPTSGKASDDMLAVAG